VARDFEPMVVWIVNLLEHDPGQVIHALVDVLDQIPEDQRLYFMRKLDREVVRRNRQRIKIRTWWAHARQVRILNSRPQRRHIQRWPG